MLIRSLLLDFDDGEEESHFHARTGSAVVSQDEIRMEFSGVQSDEGPFRGECHLVRRDALFVGSGWIESKDGRCEATVRATLKRLPHGVSLTGTWQDRGDPAAYEFAADLAETTRPR